MAETKKMTRKDELLNVMEFVKGHEDLEKTIQHYIDQIDKKALSNKASKAKNDVEIGVLKELFLNEFAQIEGQVTVGEFVQRENIANYVLENGKSISVPKATAVFTRMKDEGSIVRTQKGKKITFGLPTEEA